MWGGRAGRGVVQGEGLHGLQEGALGGSLVGQGLRFLGLVQAEGAGRGAAAAAEATTATNTTTAAAAASNSTDATSWFGGRGDF